MLLVPFLVHRLTKQGYGVFLLALSVGMVIELIRANVGKSTTIQMARHLAHHEYDHVSELLSTATVLISIVGVLGGVIVIVLRSWIVGFFTLSPEWIATFETALVLVAIRIMVAFPFMGSVGLLLALQRYDIEVSRTRSTQILRAIVIVVCFTVFEPLVELLLVIEIAMQLVLGLWVVVATRKLCPRVHLRLRHFRKDKVGEILHIGVFIFLKQIGTMLSSLGPQWVVGAMLGASYVTYLYLIRMVNSVLMRLVHTMTLVLVPVASKYESLQDRNTIAELVIRGTRYSLLLVGMVLVICIPLMRPIYTIWMGPEYAFLAPYAVVLMLACIVGAPANTSLQILDGMGKVRGTFLSTITVAIIGLALLTAAIILKYEPIFSMTLAVTAITALAGIGYQLLSLLQLDIPGRRLIWSAYVLPALAFVPPIGVVGLLNWWLGPTSVVSLGGLSALGLVTYLGVVAWKVLTPSEWRLARETLVDLRSRLRWRRRKPLG